MNFNTINVSSKPIIIACDHGYGNMKTAHAVFKTGVTGYDKEPTFKSNLLVYNGRYYLIGDEHKEFTAEKMNDQDYYILTLAAIGIELHLRGMNSARVYLAAGLPLTWVSEQKEAFKAYLLQNKEADFTFRGESYHVEFAGADVFPHLRHGQGLRAAGQAESGRHGMSNLFTTTLRINLTKPEGLKAWTYLVNRDKSMYRSYSDAIIAAVNGYHSRSFLMPKTKHKTRRYH